MDLSNTSDPDQTATRLYGHAELLFESFANHTTAVAPAPTQQPGVQSVVEDLLSATSRQADTLELNQEPLRDTGIVARAIRTDGTDTITFENRDQDTVEVAFPTPTSEFGLSTEHAEATITLSPYGSRRDGGQFTTQCRIQNAIETALALTFSVTDVRKHWDRLEYATRVHLLTYAIYGPRFQDELQQTESGPVDTITARYEQEEGSPIPEYTHLGVRDAVNLATGELFPDMELPACLDVSSENFVAIPAQFTLLTDDHDRAVGVARIPPGNAVQQEQQTAATLDDLIEPSPGFFNAQPSGAE